MTSSHPFCALVGIMRSHEYNNVDNGLPITAQTVLVLRLFNISMVDNRSVVCGYDLTNLHSKGRALTEHLHLALYVYGRWMFMQDEMSLGGFPVDIVEDLFDHISCKMCRACFTAYTSTYNKRKN